jgi:hypothetical protein
VVRKAEAREWWEVGVVKRGRDGAGSGGVPVGEEWVRQRQRQARQAAGLGTAANGCDRLGGGHEGGFGGGMESRLVVAARATQCRFVRTAVCMGVRRRGRFFLCLSDW